jgi:PAS domain S-box-containing protein
MIERRESNLRSQRARYGIAVLTAALAALLEVVWLQVFQEPAIAPFIAAILVSGWYAGVGPVIVTAILSIVAYLVLFPDHALEPSWPFAARMVWFLAFAWMAASFGAGRRRAADRLEAARRDLEGRVLARTADLQRSEEYLVAAQRLSHTGSWAWRIQENEMTWSEECARILGFPPEMRTLPRSLLTEVPHPADRERAEEMIAAALREKRGYELRMRTVRPDGTVRFVRTVARPVLNEAGEVVEFIGILMDLTARRRASRRLRRAREEAVNARIAAILEERTRLALELHDTLLQGFTGVGLNLVAVTNRVTDPPEVVTALREVVALAQRTIEKARQAIWDIRSDLPDGEELAATLRLAAEEGVRGSGLDLTFAIVGRAQATDPEVNASIFRVVREAIRNVVKHATARSVRVVLTYELRRLRLTINDDGKGFAIDPDAHAYSGHLGLVGMRERASQAHGTLSVRSAPGHGTEVVLLVDLPRRSGGSRLP